MVYWDGSEYSYTLVDGVQTWSGAGQASPDGKWLAGTFTVESLNETRDRINSTYYPAYFNTETGQTTVLEDYEGYGGCGVTDEGLAFMAAVGGIYDKVWPALAYLALVLGLVAFAIIYSNTGKRFRK